MKAKVRQKLDKIERSIYGNDVLGRYKPRKFKQNRARYLKGKKNIDSREGIK